MSTSRAGAGLGSAVRRGALWSGAFRLVSALIQLGLSVVLARLLDPDSFGLVALAAVVVGLSALLSESGLAAAIVHRPEVTREFLSAVFWMNLCLGFALWGALVALSSPIASLLGDRRVAELLPLVGLTFCLSFGVAQTGLWQRSLEFRLIGIVQTVGLAANGVVSVTLAVLGFEVWALVWGLVAQSLTASCLTLVMGRFNPFVRFDRAALSEIIRYASPLVGFNLFNYGARNVDNFLVGRVLGTVSLGYYSRAYNLFVLPQAHLRSVVSTVFFAGLASIRGDKVAAAAAWSLGARTMWLLGCATAAFVAPAGKGLVVLAYGEQWASVGPVLSCLILALPIVLLGQATGAAFQAFGRTSLQFWSGLVSSAVFVLFVIVAVPHGLVWTAGSVALASWIGLAIPVVVCLRILGLSTFKFVRSLFGPLVGFGTIGVACSIVACVCADSAAVCLLIQLVLFVCGSVGYAATFERALLKRLIGRRRR